MSFNLLSLCQPQNIEHVHSRGKFILREKILWELGSHINLSFKSRVASNHVGSRVLRLIVWVVQRGLCDPSREQLNWRFEAFLTVSGSGDLFQFCEVHGWNPRHEALLSQQSHFLRFRHIGRVKKVLFICVVVRITDNSWGHFALPSKHHVKVTRAMNCGL